MYYSTVYKKKLLENYWFFQRANKTKIKYFQIPIKIRFIKQEKVKLCLRSLGMAVWTLSLLKCCIIKSLSLAYIFINKFCIRMFKMFI